MLIRAIALSLALLVGAGTIIPLMTDYSEAGPKYSNKHKKKKIKKYSKTWWKLYRAKQRRKKAMIARRRAMRARQILMEREKNLAENTGQPIPVKSSDKSGKSAKTSEQKETVALLPSGEAAPQTWKSVQADKGEIQYRVNDDSGNALGSASLSVVGLATGQDSDSGRNKTLGGVSTGSLRRTVIDKMMKEEGWVVNDYQKDVNGKKVYVVVAQSSVKGVLQSRLFYFTEVDGRIYSLSTAAPSNDQERLAKESEKVINSLQKPNRSLQAELK